MSDEKDSVTAMDPSCSRNLSPASDRCRSDVSDGRRSGAADCFRGIGGRLLRNAHRLSRVRRASRYQSFGGRFAHIHLHRRPLFLWFRTYGQPRRVHAFGDRDDPYRFLCGGPGPDVYVVRVLRLFPVFGVRVLHLLHDDHPRDGARLWRVV